MITITLEAVAAILLGVLFIYFMHYLDKFIYTEPSPKLADYTRPLLVQADDDVTLNVIIKIGGDAT